MKHKSRRKYLNYIGNKIYLLTIQDILENSDNHGNILCTTLCDCGTHSIQSISSIIRGHTKSCGCLQPVNIRKKLFQDLTGKKYNRLLVLYLDSNTKRAKWVCQCDCGKIKSILANNLKRGSTKSCGCLHKENIPRGINHKLYKHELSIEDRLSRSKHRSVSDPQHKSWSLQVKIHYNFICQKCKQDSQHNCVSHHIYSYKEYPELRYDLNNGTCFCKQCHRLFHKKYGKSNNTYDQYIDFIINL